MCAYYAGEKSEPDDALSIFVFQAFIVDEGYFLFNDGLQQQPVMRLFLFCVREEEICFFGKQLMYRYFFDAKKDVAP